MATPILFASRWFVNRAKGCTTRSIHTYVAGGSLGNPGPSGVGVVMDGAQDGKIRIAKSIGRQDNNGAEYLALPESLQCALTLRAKTLHVYSDSEGHGWRDRRGADHIGKEDDIWTLPGETVQQPAVQLSTSAWKSPR